MRGKLYPQPRERYERFRLNPYSPLYEGLAVFMSVPPVTGVHPELHGPYALPGATFVYPVAPTHLFFPEIGRAAVTDNSSTGLFWPHVPAPQEVFTLTTMVKASAALGGGEHFASVTSALIGEYNSNNYPGYIWINGNGTVCRGYSENKYWPLNTWFTYSATFRPGSVRGYLSNWGIIDVTIYSGTWPTWFVPSHAIQIAFVRNKAFVSDTFFHLRELSLKELHAISDLGNVDYRMPGEPPLILPVRTYWPSVLPVTPSYLKRRSLGARVGTREAVL